MTETEVGSINAERLASVNGELAKACRHIIAGARGEGHILIVAEGYRTPEQQDYYYAQGRTRPGPIITNARGTQGKHTQRQAVDFDFVVNGRQSNAQGNPWNVIGRYAERAGLTWGGNWSLRDYRHVEMPSSSYRSPVDGPASSNADGGSTGEPTNGESSDAIYYIFGALFFVLLID